MWWKASDDINEAKGFVKFELGNLENDKWNRWIIVLKSTEISTTYAVDNKASGNVLQKLGFQFIKEVPYECNGGDIVTTGRYCRYKAGEI